MSLGQKIKVFVRCRPLNINERRVMVEAIPEERLIRVHGSESKQFHFDEVFGPEANQNDVYRTVVKPLIQQVLSGINCTFFAYGQTGTGKTYTMEGERLDKDLSWKDNSESGLIPRAINQLIETLETNAIKSSISVSFAEIYNEKTYDLLSSIDNVTNLEIYDQNSGSVIINGLTERVVKSKAEVYEILQTGSAKRKTAATNLNAGSSRSHTIFTITVRVTEDASDGGVLIKTGKLNFVDLAGSENVGRSGARNKLAREAGNINQSLLTLGRVISALVEKAPHIPYRESKLTRLLQDSLGGKTRTSMIATISPTDTDLDTTLSTLDYASRAMSIVNDPQINLINHKKTLGDHHQELGYLRDKYASELSDLEYKVRNEVAVEFKREIEKMKQIHKDQYEQDLANTRIDYQEKLARKNNQLEEMEKVLEEKDKTLEEKGKALEEKEKALEEKEKALELATARIKELEDSKENLTNIEHKLVTALQELAETNDKLSNNQHQLEDVNKKLKLANQLADYRDTLVKEIEKKLQEDEYQLKIVREENEELKASLKNEKGSNTTKKASKVRVKAPIPEESDADYANMTFDGGDEITQFSAKKPRQKFVPGIKRRAINQTITLSGKKRRIENQGEEQELSPIPATTNVRVTRSRASRRKLDF